MYFRFFQFILKEIRHFIVDSVLNIGNIGFILLVHCLEELLGILPDTLTWRAGLKHLDLILIINLCC